MRITIERCGVNMLLADGGAALLALGMAGNTGLRELTLSRCVCNLHDTCTCARQNPTSSRLMTSSLMQYRTPC